MVVALLLLVLFRLTDSWLAAIAGSLLFAVHPALVETVRWAICRNSLVAALWLLVGVLLYLRHLDRPGPAALWGSQLALGLSLLAKVSPAMVVIPFVLDLWRDRRIDRRALLEKVPLFVLTALLTYVNYRATVAHAADSPLQRPWSEVLGFLPEAVALMTANAIAPANLAILYSPAAMGDLLGWRSALVLAFLAAAFGGGAWAWRRGHRGVLLGVVAWFALLLPNVAAGRFRTTIASDRYLYLPILFLAAALAAGLVPILRRPAARRRPRNPSSRCAHAGRWLAASVLLALGVLLALAAGTAARRWENERRIWQRVNELAPHHMAYYMLGNLALKAERWTEAADLFARALELAQLDPYAKLDPVFSQAVLQTSRKAASELASEPDAQAQQDREALLERVNEVAAEAAANLPENPAGSVRARQDALQAEELPRGGDGARRRHRPGPAAPPGLDLPRHEPVLPGRERRSRRHFPQVARPSARLDHLLEPRKGLPGGGQARGGRAGDAGLAAVRTQQRGGAQALPAGGRRDAPPRRDGRRRSRISSPMSGDSPSRRRQSRCSSRPGGGDREAERSRRRRTPQFAGGPSDGTGTPDSSDPSGWRSSSSSLARKRAVATRSFTRSPGKRKTPRGPLSMRPRPSAK